MNFFVRLWEWNCDDILIFFIAKIIEMQFPELTENHFVIIRPRRLIDMIWTINNSLLWWILKYHVFKHCNLEKSHFQNYYENAGICYCHLNGYSLAYHMRQNNNGHYVRPKMAVYKWVDTVVRNKQLWHNELTDQKREILEDLGEITNCKILFIKYKNRNLCSVLI